MTRQHERDRMVTALVVTWVLVLFVGAGAVVLVAQHEAARTEACAAHGWDRASSRGPLCVDDNGVVRLP